MKKDAILTVKRLIARHVYQATSLIGLNQGGISVLCYHSISNSKTPYTVSLAQCLQQFAAIQRTDRFLDVSHVVRRDAKKRANSGVLITIDDGYQDVLSLVPIMRKFGIKPVLFVLSNPEHVDRKMLGHRGALLNTKQIKYLAQEGWEIGCHSATHRDLTQLSDKELTFEVITSKKRLEKSIGRKIKYFAYPKGVITKRITKAVKQAGYEAAFGTQAGQVTAYVSRYHVPRTVICASHRAQEFPILYSKSTYLIRSFVDHLPISRFVHL